MDSLPPAGYTALNASLDAKAVAAALGVSERTAQRLMRKGELAALKVGKLWRTNEESVAAYVQRGFARYRRERAA